MDDVDILLADLADLDDEEPAGLILYNRKELDESDDGYDDLNDLDDGQDDLYELPVRDLQAELDSEDEDGPEHVK